MTKYLKIISKLFVVLLLVPLLNNCKSTNSVNSGIQIFNMEPLWESSGSFLLSEIAESIDYVKLEITDNPASILGPVYMTKIKALEDYFIVYRREAPVLLYSSKGEFLNTIGHIGKGPGEYTNVGSIMTSEDEKSIWIVELDANKMIHYSIEGEHIKDIAIDKNGCKGVIHDNQIYLLCLAIGYEFQDESKIDVLDLEGNVLNQVPLYVDRRWCHGRQSYIFQQLAFVDNHLHHFEPPYDTVFSLQEDGQWSPQYAFDSGRNRIPFKVFCEGNPNLFKPYSFINLVKETEDYYFIEGVHQQQGKNMIAHKSEGWVKNCDYTNDKLDQVWRFSGMENDIDGGLPFWPYYTYKNEFTFTLIDPLNMIEFTEAMTDIDDIDPAHRKKLNELLANLDEEDNPIVMRVNLKK